MSNEIGEVAKAPGKELVRSGEEGSLMRSLSSSTVPHDHMFRRLFALYLVPWLIIGMLPGAASSRIRQPSMEELVDSADLIITGRVNSVQLTSSGWYRTISLATVGILAPILVLVAWRRRGRAEACIVALFLVTVLGFLLGPRPASTYYKVADVSVSQKIKGTASPGHLLVFYDRKHPCDETYFAVQQEYLLFLKEKKCGYTTSWYDCSVWTIEHGCAQTARRARRNCRPIELNRAVLNIEQRMSTHALVAPRGNLKNLQIF